MVVGYIMPLTRVWLSSRARPLRTKAVQEMICVDRSRVVLRMLALDVCWQPMEALQGAFPRLARRKTG